MVQRAFLSMLSLATTVKTQEVAQELPHRRHERAVIKLLLNLVLYVIFCHRKRKAMSMENVSCLTTPGS